MRKDRDLFALMAAQISRKARRSAAKQMAVAFAIGDNVVNVPVDESVINPSGGPLWFVKGKPSSTPTCVRERQVCR